MTRSQTEDNKTESQVNVPSVERTRTERSPLSPTKVSVSVTIPTEYYLQIWQQRNPPAAGQTAKKPDPNEMEGLEKEVETPEIDEVFQQVQNRLWDHLKL